MAAIKTIPNQRLMNKAMNIEKFELRLSSESLVHWYINPDGNEEDGILQEDVVPFWLITECLEAYDVDSAAFRPLAR